MSRRSVRQDALADLAGVRATSRWVTTDDGLRLHLLDYDVGEDLPIMLVAPGITMPAIGMDFVASALVDVVRPVVVDARGRGLSDDGREQQIAAHARDLLAVRHGLDGPVALMMGHSMGARTAVASAVMEPGELIGVIAVDPPTSGPERSSYPTPVEVFLGQIDEAHADGGLEAVARSWPRWPRSEQELRERWLSSCSRRAVAGTHASFESEDFVAWWGALTTPAVLMCGGESPVIDSVAVTELLKARHGDVAMVAGAGHMVFWDQPYEAIGCLRQLIDVLLAGQAGAQEAGAHPHDRRSTSSGCTTL